MAPLLLASTMSECDPQGKVPPSDKPAISPHLQITIEFDKRESTSYLSSAVFDFEALLAGGGSTSSCRYAYENKTITLYASNDESFSISDFTMSPGGYQTGFVKDGTTRAITELVGWTRTDPSAALYVISLESWSPLDFNPCPADTSLAPPSLVLGRTIIARVDTCYFGAALPWSMVFEGTIKEMVPAWAAWLRDNANGIPPIEDDVLKSTTMHELLHGFGLYDSYSPYIGNRLCHDDATAGTYNWDKISLADCKCIMNNGPDDVATFRALCSATRTDGSPMNASRAADFLVNDCLCEMHRIELETKCPFSRLAAGV
jgi:hypothetical protein